jgi:hypothetical protein
MLSKLVFSTALVALSSVFALTQAQDTYSGENGVECVTGAHLQALGWTFDWMDKNQTFVNVTLPDLPILRPRLSPRAVVRRSRGEGQVAWRSREECREEIFSLLHVRKTCPQLQTDAGG